MQNVRAIPKWLRVAAFAIGVLTVAVQQLTGSKHGKSDCDSVSQLQQESRVPLPSVAFYPITTGDFYQTQADERTQCDLILDIPRRAREHKYSAYLSPKDPRQKSAASDLVIRNESPAKLPFGNMALSSESI